MSMAETPLDPSGIESMDSLVLALEALRKHLGLSYGDLERSANRLTAMRKEPHRLSSSTLHDMLKRAQVSEEKLRTFVLACGLPETALEEWLQAWRRAKKPTHAPCGSELKVRDANPRLLGVHRAIESTDDYRSMPDYVLRDTDLAINGLRTTVNRATVNGGFILLVGGSSSGKTRCAYEAIRAIAPDWWLLHPGDLEDIEKFSEAPSPRTVIWLDELQLYLDHHRGLRPGMVRKLIGSKIPVIIIGTLWPEFYTAYTRDAILNLESNLGFERELMRLAEVVHIGDSLSDRETERARQAAKTDRRIRESLRSHDYGMTQFLAAGPLLIDAWKSADRYASALLHAAISVSLLGIRTPLDLEMIKSVAITNITGRALALAKPDWFDVALSYCTEPLRGAASLLEPVATDLGKITGYKVADYVLQSASMEPRYSRITEGAWQYLATHIVELNDLRRLAQAAEIRLIYSIALPLRRKLSELGRRGDLLALAMLLAKQDQKEDATELLWSNVKPQDYNESLKLADLLIEKRDIERLALLADSGNEHIADELAKWLKSIGNIRDLARRADAGDGKAAEHYYQLLVDQGNIDTLSVYSNSGDKRAEWHLSRLLALQCKLPELRESAEAGKRNARRQLATTLASMGRQEELKSLADAGDLDALGMAARLPEGGKYLRELTDHADRGTQGAAMILVSALMFLDDTETLKKRAANGDVLSGAFLASYLSVKKDKQALEDMVRSGDTIAAFMLGQVLGGEKDLEGLMDLSNVHGSFAAKEVCRILAERGDIDALISNTLAGQYDASQYLIEALEKCGRADDARRLKKYGLTADGDIAERLE